MSVPAAGLSNQVIQSQGKALALYLEEHIQRCSSEGTEHHFKSWWWLLLPLVSYLGSAAGLIKNLQHWTITKAIEFPLSADFEVDEACLGSRYT